MPRIVKEEELTEYLDASKPVSAFSMLDSPRSMFYHYMIQECALCLRFSPLSAEYPQLSVLVCPCDDRALLEGLLLDGTGIDPSAYSVAPAIKNGTAPHPDVPTFVVHGTIDDKVNIEQADDVVNAMKAKGLSVGTCLSSHSHSVECCSLPASPKLTSVGVCARSTRRV